MIRRRRGRYPVILRERNCVYDRYQREEPNIGRNISFRRGWRKGCPEAAPVRASSESGSREEIVKKGRKQRERERERALAFVGNWQPRRLLLVRAIIRLEELSAQDDWSTCPSDRDITITTTIVSRKAITARELWPRDTVDVHVRSDLLEVIDHRSCREDDEEQEVGAHGRPNSQERPTSAGTYYPGTFVTKIRLYAYDGVPGPDRPPY